MKIRTKILCGFMVVSLFTVILGITGLISTEKLNGISNELQYMQVENDSITKVLNAHYIWRQNLIETVISGKEFNGSLDPRTCALGKWYSSNESKKMNDPKLLEMLKSLDEPHRFIHEEAKNVVAFIKDGDYAAAKDSLERSIFPKTAEVISILTGMQSQYVSIVSEKEIESIRIAGINRIVNIGIIIVSVVVCVFMAVYIANLISKPLTPLAAFMMKAGTTGDLTLLPEDEKNIRKHANAKGEIGQTINGAASFIMHVTKNAEKLESVANGDLTIDVDMLSDRDTMGKSVKQVVDNLNNMFGEINISANQVSLGAKQVSAGAQSLAQGSTEQAAAIQQLSSSIAHIANKTKENAVTADETSKLSENIIQDAERGSQKMDEMIVAVSDINEASKNISKIIKTIDDIAFQTNFLALNAAVEAARAGQHGKGFAVVAEEVRNLASKSAEAAKDTDDMIQNSMEKAALGSRIAEDTAESLREIVSGITEASQRVSEIAESSEKQSIDITQINIGIDQVAQVVQQNSATAEESAAASEEMNSRSHALEEMILQFKLREHNVVGSGLPAIGDTFDY